MLFNHWRENRDNPGNFSSEHSKILSAVRDFIERFSESRFSNINASPSVTPSGYVIDPPLVRDRAGYWDDSSGSRIYLFINTGLREATKGHDFNRALKALDDAGAFAKTGANERSIATRMPDKRIVRLFWIDPEKLN